MDGFQIVSRRNLACSGQTLSFCCQPLNRFLLRREVTVEKLVKDRGIVSRGLALDSFRADLLDLRKLVLKRVLSLAMHFFHSGGSCHLYQLELNLTHQIWVSNSHQRVRNHLHHGE